MLLTNYSVRVKILCTLASSYTFQCSSLASTMPDHSFPPENLWFYAPLPHQKGPFPLPIQILPIPRAPQTSPCFSSKLPQRTSVYIHFLSSLISRSIIDLDNALGDLITYPFAQLLGLYVVFKVPGGPVCGRTTSASN